MGRSTQIFFIVAASLLAGSAHAAVTVMGGGAGAVCSTAAFAGDSSDASLLACDVRFFVAVLVFARDRGAISAVLATAPFQALGRWSYSIYMTQMLVIRVGAQALLLFLLWLGRDELIRPVTGSGFSRIDFGLLGNTALSLAVAAICIAFSALTFRLIEQPGREWARRKARKRGAAGAEAVAPTI